MMRPSNNPGPLLECCQRSSMRLCILVFTAALGACSAQGECASTAPCLRAADAAVGSWKEIEAWRGTSMRISLIARDTTLFGTAAYTTTSGTGTASISGFVFWQQSAAVPSGRVEPAHPAVVLNFALSNGTSARFDQGVFAGRDTLSGVLTFSDAPFTAYGTSFVRAPQ